MHENKKVSEMADEVLRRQARVRAERSGEPFEGALEAVLRTEAGRRLEELRDGPHGDEEVDRWQEGLPRKRARERERDRAEKRTRARLVAAWEPFIEAELEELELRKNGQLARLLGEALPGEPADTLRRLAEEDRRQAEAGLVALISNGKVSYKHLKELCPEDRPGRIAANRSRTAWLKGRRDQWLARPGPEG